VPNALETIDNMPVYLGFLQVAKKSLQLALRGPNLPTSLEACKLRQGGPGTDLYYIKIECPLICSKKIAREFSYIYQADKIVGC
jgi:hypothetical protein